MFVAICAHNHMAIYRCILTVIYGGHTDTDRMIMGHNLYGLEAHTDGRMPYVTVRLQSPMCGDYL
jgi:hypothetical protein